ncbi:MAG: hypothetical protein GC145_08160 [Caulobacter sp.]|nr:hypothetical protein [Caulobacter sp.]
MIRSAVLLSITLALAACGLAPSAPPPSGPEAAPSPPATAVKSPSVDAGEAPPSTGLISCETQLGVGPARTLADQCRNVSPATRPPCNIANSCALIRDEIARGCGLLGDDAARAGCAVDPRGAEGAADVVRRYYEALNARDYATAYSQWRADGEGSGKTFADFSAGFAHTRSTVVTLGSAGDVEGAAGSLYVTIPVTVDAVLDDGTRQRFKGSYDLRRVNGVDGATPEQLRWKLASATLKSAD